MKELEERILRDGVAKAGDVLKVDNFLNHQIDPKLLKDMAYEWARLYEGEKITKVLTIEASGIAMAIMVAEVLNCPLLFAKKSRTSNIADDVYAAPCHSYTHGTEHTIIASKQYLGPEDHVLIIDDFLAMGEALRALISIVEQAGATLVGCGVAVEKAYQPGGDDIRSRGVRVEALARVASMDDNVIKFVD